MVVLKDRILFMFSEENPYNLWNQRYFNCLLTIIRTIIFIYMTKFMGEYICCNIQGFTKIDGLHYFVYFIIYLFCMLLSTIVYGFIRHLFNEIKSSFKTHEEIIKLKNK